MRAATGLAWEYPHAYIMRLPTLIYLCFWREGGVIQEEKLTAKYYLIRDIEFSIFPFNVSLISKNTSKDHTLRFLEGGWVCEPSNFRRSITCFGSRVGGRYLSGERGALPYGFGLLLPHFGCFSLATEGEISRQKIGKAWGGCQHKYLCASCTLTSSCLSL